MRLAPKLVLGSGVVLLLVGIVITIIGGSMIEDVSPESEDWSGKLIFQGVTPTVYEEKFDWDYIYNVWISEEADASKLKIEVTGTEAPGYFVPCEELDDCDIFDQDGKIPYYKYIGEIQVEQSGEYKVNFNVISGYDFEVMVREDTSLLGILGSIGGTALCCGGFILIIIGAILASIMDNKSNSLPQLYHIVEDEGNSVNYSDNIPPITSIEEKKVEIKQEGSNWWESEIEKE